MQLEKRPIKEYNENQIERSKYVYDKTISWIENADNKVGVSCGVFTGAFGVISFLSQRIPAESTVDPFWQSSYRVFSVLSFLVMAFSILFYVLAINPNLGSNDKKKYSKGLKKCPIYFGDISGITLEKYKDAMNNASENDFNDELQNEIHYNADICKYKMKKYKVGLWLSYTAVILSGISWISKIFMN